jgi:serine/threonine protein kinase
MDPTLVLGDRYRLDKRLAVGGMGEVWRATDELLGRPVAVKLLKEQYVSDDSFRDRFRAEARFAASLQHSGIAQVYDYGEQGELAYLVMELVLGETLSRIMTVKGRLSAETTLDIVGQAARALQVAHDTGIIHRDIKPANLMVTADGTVKITDFGIARGGSATVTQTGQVMGTAQYISPEQATGARITPASDLYSLGVVAYECLAGRPPFAADTPLALALMHVREDAPPLPDDVPPAVRGLVSSLVAKDPADRPADAQEVADRAHLIRRSQGLDDDALPAETRIAQTGSSAQVPYTEPAGTRLPTAPGGAVPAQAGSRLRSGRVAIVAACAVILLGTGVLTVGSLWKHHGHSKLVDGNRVERAAPTASPTHLRRVPSSLPTDRPVPSDSFSPPEMSTSPAPSATISTPTTKPTRTIKPPERTPTVPATNPPPTSPDPLPSSSSEGQPAPEGRA